MTSRSKHPMYRNQRAPAKYSSSSGSDKCYVAGFNGVETESPPAEMVDYQTLDMQQLERRRQDEYQNQDAMLDQIHHGVKGLKNHAHAINGEVVEQNVMIDDINDRMDGAQRVLESEEQRAREVNAKKNKVCKLYITIAVLIVILIVISILSSYV